MKCSTGVQSIEQFEITIAYSMIHGNSLKIKNDWIWNVNIGITRKTTCDFAVHDFCEVSEKHELIDVTFNWYYTLCKWVTE